MQTWILIQRATFTTLENAIFSIASHINDQEEHQ